MLRFANYAFANMEIGFTKYQTQGDRRNFTHYLNKGYYLKAGVDFTTNRRARVLAFKRATYFFSLAFFYSHFSENATFQIKDSFFGDYVDNFERPNHSTCGGELGVSFWQPISQKFAFVLGYRASFFKPINIDQLAHPQLPIAYFLNIGLNLGSRGGNGTGLGVDGKLIFRIF
jgi:hypothetical protein